MIKCGQVPEDLLNQIKQLENNQETKTSEDDQKVDFFDDSYMVDTIKLDGFPFYKNVICAGRSFSSVLQHFSLFETGEGVHEENENEEEEEENDDEDDNEERSEEEEKIRMKYKKKQLKTGKEQDHYELLGLGHLRWNANDDDIKKAYRAKALEYHPDRQAKKGIEDDSMFKAVVLAYETLSDPRKKRAFDSSEDFDDKLPNVNGVDFEKHPNLFFDIFEPEFNKWGKWSSSKNIQRVGDMKTKWSQVDKFYKSWTTFKSWREFSFEDEYDVNESESREEKRYLEQQNERVRRKKKKAESKRIRELVDLAKKCDPRVKKRRKQLEDERKRKEEEVERKRVEKILVEQRKREEQDRKEQEKKKQIEEQRRAEKEKKEKEKRELKEQQDEFRRICTPYIDYSPNLVIDSKKPSCIGAVDFEYVNLRMKTEQLIKFNEILKNLEKDKAVKQFYKAFEKIKTKEKEEEEQKKKDREEEKRKKQEEEQAKDNWTRKEVAALAKAIALYPGGTPQRWKVIAKHVGTKSPKEVQAKTAEIRKMTSRGKAIQKIGEKEHFGDFLENMKKTETSKKQEAVKKENDVKKAMKSSVENWTADQQKLLETGIKKNKGSAPDKWDKIAAMVEGKTKEECVERFQYCKKIALEKRKAKMKK